MSHDSLQGQQYFSDNLVRLPEQDAPDTHESLDGIESSFVFDFQTYDEPDDAPSAGPPGSTSSRSAAARSRARTGW